MALSTEERLRRAKQNAKKQEAFTAQVTARVAANAQKEREQYKTENQQPQAPAYPKETIQAVSQAARKPFSVNQLTDIFQSGTMQRPALDVERPKVEEQQNATTDYDKLLKEKYAQLENTAPSGNLNDPTRYNLMQEIRQLEQKKADWEKAEAERRKAVGWEAKQQAGIRATGDETLPDDLKRLRDLKVELDKATAQSMNSAMGSVRMNEAQQEYSALLKELQGKYGEKLDGWQSYVSRVSNQEDTEKMQEELSAKAKEKPFWMSAATLPVNLASGIGFVDVAGQKAQRLLTGSDVPIDYNTPGMRPAQITNAIRGGVSEKIEEDTAGKFGSDTALGNLYSGAYNLGMSMGDSAIGLLTGSSMFMAGSAATNAMLEAKERGATDNQALLFGLASGAMEGVMEKLSIDSLLSAKDPKTARQLFLGVLEQGGVEGLEELNTNLATTLADAIIMGDKSQLNTTKNYYIQQGHSPEEAEKLAKKEWGKSLALDAIGGFISGGLFETAKGGTGYISNNLQNQQPKSKPIDNTWTPEQKANLDRWLDDWMQEGRDPAAVVTQDVLGEKKTAPVVETEANDPDEGILVYRGYNRSTDGTERNLSYNKTIDDVLGKKVQGDAEMLPFTYYTDSVEDAESYANMDFNYLKFLQERYGEEQGIEAYKTLTGRDAASKGAVQEHRINPKKVLDLTSLGEETTVGAVYRFLSQELGIPATSLDGNDIDGRLVLSDIEEGEDNFPTFKVLRNLPRSNGDIGTRFFNLLKEFGYDSVKYRESGANHYAVIQEQTKKTSPTVEDIMPKPASAVDVDAAFNNVRAEGTAAGVTYDSGTVGDMGAKTSEHRHEVKESQSKTTPYYYEKNNIPEEGRADNHYTVVHRDESLHNATSRLEQDYDGEVADLRRKTTWSDEEMLEGDLILRKLRDEAEKTGDWSKHREWAKVFGEHKSEAGRSLAVLAMLSNENGDKILSNAAAKLETATKGTDADAVMQTVSEYATRYDEAVAAKNVDELINIIKETARTRKTGFYSGKLGEATAKPLDWALNRIANYAKADPAAGTVTATIPKTFKVGDVVIPSDRGNFGKIAAVNDDGTYDVHFIAKSGHEATKTFAAEDLKSPHTGGVTAADISADPNSAFAFLKSFAAAGIENIASDTNRASVTSMAKTIRRNAMLSKFSTIMRNLVGNGVFDGVDTLARNVSVPLDMLLSKATGTRSVAADYGYLSEAKRKGMVDGLAMAMLETSLDVNARSQQSKYENGSNRTFKMSGGVVSKMLSTWEGLMGYGLYVTDEMSKGGTSAEVQRGLNRLYEQGKIKVGDDSLRDGGAQEALYRTFQDDTVLSQMATGMRDALNKAHVGDFGFGDTLMPFAQVPANLPDRAIDYTPAGLAKSAYGLTYVLIKAKKGTLTAAEQAKAVQTLGRNITGTGLLAIAAAAAAKGIIRVVNPGGEDENKDKAAFEKMQGQNGTQWNLSAMMRDLKGESTDWQDDDVLMSIAFLEPFNAQLTIGALLAEDMEAEGRLTAKTAFKDTVVGALTALGNLPMFSAFGEAYNAYQYSDKERDSERWLDAWNTLLANEASSIIPNSVKGIAQGLDPYQRDLYSKDGAWAQTGDQFRAIFDRDSLPIKQDSFGNPMKNEGGVQNFLNTNIRPGQITTYKTDDVMDKITDLSELTGATSVYPSRKAPDNFSVGGENFVLSDEQKTQYQSAYGKTEQDVRAALIVGDLYKNLDTDGELKAHTYAEDYAKQVAKEAINPDYEQDPWVAELQGKSPEEIAEAIVMKSFEALANNKKQYENKYIGISGLAADGMIDNATAAALFPDSMRQAYYDHAEKSGVTAQQWAEAYGHAMKHKGSKEEQRSAALDYISGMDMPTVNKTALAKGLFAYMYDIIPKEVDLPKNWLG